MRALPSLLRFTTESIERMVHNYIGQLTDLPAAAMPRAAKLDGLPRLASSRHVRRLRLPGDLLARQLEGSGMRNRA
ncbi:hypothetical protein [Streptomyces hokutonensis]|uniref:hypothetical protein n=1 Tax=Streptomyces hokutonensis TaxID=1306990 RepID=UPI0036AAAA00